MEYYEANDWQEAGYLSPSIGSGPHTTGGSISISGGTIITNSAIGISLDKEDDNNKHYTKTTIDVGKSVIFATKIQGGADNDSLLTAQADKGIADKSGAKVVSNDGGSNGTIKLLKPFTVPSGTKLTIPSGWTLYKNGQTFTQNGTVTGNVQERSPPSP